MSALVKKNCLHSWNEVKHVAFMSIFCKNTITIFFLRFSTYKIQIGIETREPIDANFCIFKIRTSLNMQ